MDGDRWMELARTLVEPHREEQCTACLDQLDAYVEAQLTAQPYATLFRHVAQHLDGCVRCAEDYARVYDARLAQASAVVPATKRVPNLGFLLPSGFANASGGANPAQVRARLRADRLEAAFTHRLEQSVGRMRLLIDQTLLALLPPPQAGGLAFRDAGEPQPRIEMTLEHPSETVTQLELRAYDDAQTGAQTIRCTVGVLDREWPELADIVVRLQWDEQQREVLTDAWGEAMFTDVPADALARMIVEVDTTTMM